MSNTVAQRRPACRGALLTLALILGVALSIGAHAREYDDIIQSGFIRLGVYQDFQPYSYEIDGEPAGVDVDLGKAIAAGLGLEPVFHWLTPDETLEDDLRNGIWKGHYLQERDLAGRPTVADVMLRVPYDRQLSLLRDEVGQLKYELVHFFGPYQQESWQAMYDSGRMDELKTVAKFQYHPVGVEVDSLPATYLAAALGGVLREQAHHYPDIRAAYEAMRNGEVSAIIGMRAEIDSLLSQAGDERYRLAENGFPGMGRQAWDIGMAIHTDNRQLGYAVDDIVREMVLSGGMNELFARHGLRYAQPAYYQEVARSK